LPLGGVIVNRVQPGASSPSAKLARQLAETASADQAKVLLQHATRQERRVGEQERIRRLLPASVPRVLVPRRLEATDLPSLRELEFLALAPPEW
ncbi:MAG: hypothetical protein WAS07_00940, partial [Micropruina sp.]